MHDFLRERRVCTNVVTTRGGTKFFNLPVHFQEPLAQQVLTVSDLQGFLVRWARGFTLGRSMIRTRALPPPPPQSGYRRSGCPSRSLLDWIIRLRGVPRRSGWHWDLLVQHRLHRLRETTNVLDELVELLRIHCGYRRGLSHRGRSRDRRTRRGSSRGSRRAPRRSPSGGHFLFPEKEY